MRALLLRPAQSLDCNILFEHCPFCRRAREFVFILYNLAYEQACNETSERESGEGPARERKDSPGTKPGSAQTAPAAERLFAQTGKEARLEPAELEKGRNDHEYTA
jgi:hypothetical protein